MANTRTSFADDAGDIRLSGGLIPDDASSSGDTLQSTGTPGEPAQWAAGGGSQSFIEYDIQMGVGDMGTNYRQVGIVPSHGSDGAPSPIVASALASIPSVVSAANAVAAPVIVSVSGLPVDADSFDLQATLTVTNQDGTEIATAVGATTLDPGSTEGSIDWDAAVFTQVAGTDLTYDGNVVSAAGGVFSVALTASFSWD